MEKGYSVSTEVPAGYSPDFEFFLFGHPQHLTLQSPEWTQYFLLRKSNQKVMAQVAFHIKDHIARSPFRAPFDSFLFSERLSPLVLYEFVHQVERLLARLGVAIISLTEPPLYYRKNGELLHAILLNQGYRAEKAELSSGILIDRTSFEDKVETWEKRKLRQAKQKGAQFKTLPLDKLPMVYQFIIKCREQRSHTLSMTLPELEATVNKFRSEFILSGVFLNKDLIAASIAIKVHRDILYNFYSGHLKKYDPISPAVTLIGGLYKYSEQHKVKLLDLGTSHLHDQPNFTLLEFKLRLGASPSIKLTFEKQLA
ncbi:MAG: hypothetical protein JNK10_12325 [Cyclobacteriaceae bacterium]|nr:hypothetical protein [Cyclobacteriaceae bacterium]